MIFKQSKKKTLDKYILENKEKFYKIAFVYLRNRENALDIVQDSILKSYTYIEKLKDIEALDKWFTKLLINTAIDFIRKNSKMVYLDNSNLDYLIDKKLREEKTFNEIISSLDLELKGVIILKYFYGYKISEVSEILGISESDVKNKMHKSLKLLRKEISEEVL